MKLSIIFLFLSGVLFASPQVTKDYSKGRDIAQGYDLPLALVFTGSDWSEHSKTLIEEMFEKLPSELIFVQVDFPEINTQSETILIQNRVLKEKYGVENFPTIVLLNSKEEEISRMGYPIKGVGDFGKYLKEVGRRYYLLEKRFEEAKQSKKVGELKYCYEEARSMGAKSLARTILNMGGDVVPELMLEKYIALRGTEEGNALRAALNAIESKEIASRLALLDFQEKNSVKPLEQFIDEFGEKSADHCWKMHLVISEFMEDKEEALEHAQVSHRFAPGEEKSNIAKIISRLLPSESP
jgi:thiol-disulfide isomerase/thioredoxin